MKSKIGAGQEATDKTGEEPDKEVGRDGVRWGEIALSVKMAEETQEDVDLGEDWMDSRDSEASRSSTSSESFRISFSQESASESLFGDSGASRSSTSSESSRISFSQESASESFSGDSEASMLFESTSFDFKGHFSSNFARILAFSSEIL